MSSYSEFSESPTLPTETWCPDCSGPPISDRASVLYCRDHMPATHSSVDNEANLPVVASWMAEAGGEGNRNMCALIHKETNNV